MPNVSHLIYIPGVLLIGFAIGWVTGIRVARKELSEKKRGARRSLRE